ncbi:MAG TPA: hypothetical protein VE078_03805, partial [Thermoanaerobaculia bacterium]|nr:hypothetical protein [Thermoanaerobaculia bacterium]
MVSTIMSRYHGTSAAVVSLIFLAISLRADASEIPGARACESKLEANANGEEPALCFYEMAIGTTPSRAAAGTRLAKLQAEHPGNPWFSFYLANLKWSTHDPAGKAEAQRLYALTAELAHGLGVAKAEYQANASLSQIFRDSGRLNEAQAALSKAVRLAEESGDRGLRTRAGILQANHWSAQGDFQRAYFILRQLRETVAAETPYSVRVSYLFSLGGVTLQTGRFREMQKAYGQLAELAEANKDLATQAQAVYGLALSRKNELEELPTDTGREELLRLANQALNLARTAKRPSAEAEPLWLLGSFGNRREAPGHLVRCFAVAGTPRQRSYCRTALAGRLATSDPAAALKAIEEAMALAQVSRDVPSQTSLWSTRMRVSWQIGSSERALADSEAALDAIEALRDQQGGSSSQPGLFSTWAEAYYWLSGRLLEAGELEAGFRAIERMRSRTLIDALGVSQPGPGVPPALLARRSDLSLDIAQVQRRLLDPSVGRNERIEARAELERLEVAEANLRAQIANADPEFAALRPPSFVSLSQVRGALAPDEALLSFQIAPWQDLAGDFAGGSWLLVSSRGDTRLYRLPGRTELRPAVDAFTGMFGARDGSDAQAAP